MAEPFTVDARVDVERLRLLQAAQTEYPALDYKQTCDLSTSAGKCELVKDAAGMMSLPDGGYIAVGLDGHGHPVGAGVDAPSFDEAKLRALLVKHLEVSPVVASAVHDVDGHQVVLLYFGRRADAPFPIVKADVTHLDSTGKSVTPLRAGDVFFRDGTQTRRWRSGDLPALLAPYLEQVRRQERDRLGELLEQMQPALRGQRLSQGPLASLSWRLPQDEYDAAVAELSRGHDTAALRRLTLQLRRDGAALMSSGLPEADAEVRDLLDRATSALSTAIVHVDRELFDQALAALKTTYDAGILGDDGTPRSDAVVATWVDVAARVLGLIALASRLEEWWAVRPLTLQPVGTSYRRASWLRHAFTWGHRQLQLPAGESGKPLPGALIALARHVVSRLPALRPDVAGEDLAVPVGTSPAHNDPLTDSLCQADLLWCVIAAAAGEPRDFYPSFGALFGYRTEPIVHRLLHDPDLVQQLVPDFGGDVKDLLRPVLELAAQESHFDDLVHLLK